MTTTNILLAGVGGQGIMLAGEILARLGLELGFDVKKSEIHGMAQRGGSVESHVRMGPEILSPLIPRGRADFLVALEQGEALRYVDFPEDGATVLLSNTRFIPSGVTAGLDSYPPETRIMEELSGLGLRVIAVDTEALVRKIGNPRALNIIMLGRLSTLLPFPEETWKSVITDMLPEKILAVNLRAFDLGRATLG
ncbi:MAG: indolepyruvate oxidoreductase subunit beta [Pseudomonadota bacterium]